MSKFPNADHNRTWLSLILLSQAVLVFGLSLRFQGLWISDDEFPYLGQAVSLWLGHFPLDPTRPLLYPLSLSLGLRLFGYDLFWLRLGQGLFLVLTTALVYRLAFRAAGPRPALVAAALFAFFPDGLFFAHHFYREPLAAFLLLLALNLLLAFDRPKKFTPPLAGGLVFGLLILLKPEFSSLFALLVPILLGLALRDRAERAGRLQFTALFVLAAGLMVLQMVSVDRIIYNEWIFGATYKGYNYSLSYCGQLSDPKAGRPPFSFSERDGERYQLLNPEAGRLLYNPASSLSYGERDAILAQKARACLRAEPKKALYFYGARWLEGLFRLDEQALHWVLKGAYGAWPQPRIWLLLLASISLNLVLLAGIGLAPLRFQLNLPSALALLAVLWHLFYYASVFYISRFRIATFPCFIILAAVGLVGPGPRLNAARWKKALALVYAALSLVLVFSNFINADNLRPWRRSSGEKHFVLGPGAPLQDQVNYFILFGNRFRAYGRLDLLQSQFGPSLKKMAGGINPASLLAAARYYDRRRDPLMTRFYAARALEYPSAQSEAKSLLDKIAENPDEL